MLQFPGNADLAIQRGFDDPLEAVKKRAIRLKQLRNAELAIQRGSDDPLEAVEKRGAGNADLAIQRGFDDPLEAVKKRAIRLKWLRNADLETRI